MTKNTDIDAQIALIQDKVEKQKKVVLDIEKKSSKTAWNTNCQLNLPTRKFNLHTSNEQDLISGLADLLALKDYHDKARKILKLEEKVEFKHDGYTLAEWTSDIEAKLAKHRIKKEKEKLENLEKRIGGILSEDQKRSNELKRIIEELGDE
jgi:hypothetical protein